MTRRRIVLVLLAAGVALGASAGAGATGQTLQRPDLSSRAAVNNYLISIGVNPNGVVVQRGARVYAGPNCPGAAWTCTRAMQVVQLAAVQNKFECTPVAAQSVGTDQGANACFIMQGGPGKNEATCSLENTDTATPSSISQTCSIDQTNTENDNVATIKMVIGQTGVEGAQDAHQLAHVVQSNETGDNFSTIEQRISQTENTADEDVSQNQNSEQDFTLEQTALTGTQKSTAKQTQQLKQNAPNSLTGSQLQSSDFDGDVFQDSAGVSHATNQQTEQQTQIAGGLGVGQTQFGPISCCSFQGTNPEDKFTIQQSSIQSQKPGPPFDQSNQVNGDCFSYGKCTVQSSVKEGNQSVSDTCTSQGFVSEGVTPDGCSTNVSCEGGFCSTECSECEDFLRPAAARSTGVTVFRPLARLLRLHR